MEVMINNLQDELKVDPKLEALIVELITNTAQEESISTGEVSVALVDNEHIQRLNKRYRQQDQVTDVLSFPQDDELLGDIIISLPRAESQAREYGHSLAREVGFLTVHGMLHLLGYDHQDQQSKRVMRKKEEQILAELDLSRE
ncbi:rRNA maturation RNase YbeY [Fuchsiella alkaliacetigena]|uniref:rRNA maturation RNase YbeY n=1 Tax=Fuchsiella alkaliacetigena TaxID=957042 RepID=UPI00200ADADB|nr:rRNA maturation RNase YbeY [Fuchsiella alkaliacetigena]MCK8824460.1 rRNA maturation RNase YbeY [Fuchsiella alkaliacetigena]